VSAISKTEQLLRLDLPLHLLVKNKENPNRMSSREFDLLCDNIEKTGLTDPLLCRPDNFALVHDLAHIHRKTGGLVQALVDADAKFRIVGGHHRFDAAAFIGFDVAPCTIIMDPEFDAEQESFQIVRMNVIRGKMDPNAFFNMFSKLSESYSEEVLQDAFGFASEREFQALINQAAKSLPDPKMQAKFKEAAAEVKTIDGLSKLLNSMFTKYGDTLPYGYMVVDYGGQRSIWVRVDKKTMDALDLIAEQCIESKKTMDDVLGGLLRRLAKGEIPEVMKDAIEAAPPAGVPDGFPLVPTKDNLDKAASL
jgi:hypothetical protein